MTLIPQKSIDSMQLRIKHEEFNWKTYNAMSNWLNLHGYEGASKLFKQYADDELIHKQWAIDYLLDMNIQPIEPSEEQPKITFTGLPQIIALSYELELKTTNEIAEFITLCLKENDHMTRILLEQKYMTEQREELASRQMWLDKLDSFGTSEIALRMLDEDMGDKA